MPKKMPEIKADSNNQPIDAVVSWVDGNDPEFRKRMQPYLEGKSRRSIPGAHPTRFASLNEIRYSVLSILTFAPFVRKIFIITAGQNPELDIDIKQYFPERVNDIKIVDHSEIFRGYEHYLPTFSSRSIETMMWRIEGLSERFIYSNDDIFLVRKTTPSDWFVDQRPVLRGRWLARPTLRIWWQIISVMLYRKVPGKGNYQPKPSYHMGQWLGASVAGFKYRYFFFSHTPFAVNKNTIEKFFLLNRPLLEKNIAHKFKNFAQFNMVALAYHLELLNGNRQLANPELVYLHPYKRHKNYIDKKIRSCEQNGQVKFLCVQSLEMCSKEAQQKVFTWLDKTLGLMPLNND